MASAASPEVAEAVVRAHREWAFVLAATIRVAGDIDSAEEAVQDAYASALATWDRRGIPANPAAWLTVAARRRALDMRRREATARRALPKLLEPEPEPVDELADLGDDIPDERLRLIFTCCHPALAPEAQVALTLRLVCGLSTAEIARAFLVPEATMAARITRAKRKIRVAGIPYRVPDGDELGADPRLARYPYRAAARADCLIRLGRPAEARVAYDEALILTENEVERDFLIARSRALDGND